MNRLERKINELPINERIALVMGIGRDSTKLRVSSLNCEGNYYHEKRGKVKKGYPKNQYLIGWKEPLPYKIFGVMGPCYEEPNFFIVKNSEELNEVQKLIRKERENFCKDFSQVQLIIQEKMLQLRTLDYFHSNPREISIFNEEKILFRKGINDKGASEVWKPGIKNLISYFIDFSPPDITSKTDFRIIYSSKECKNVLFEAFNELGIKKHC